MAEIRVDFTKTIGAIKPLHGVGQPPFSGGSDFRMLHYLTEAGIPFSRLHDVGGTYGGGRFVDIPNLFRNFAADPEDPASYDFTFTDILITEIVKSGVEPFFRLGVTIENDAAIKSYRIDPPSDPQKWAVVCEKVIRHYTEGWANGFTYNIRYWEIWNEPDNGIDARTNQMWTGTPEQYYELYDVTAKHLKACFPHLKIGGYASCGFYGLYSDDPRMQFFMTFFDGFLAYIREHGSPMDFFSWHSYDNIPHTVEFADYAKKKLIEAGYPDAETTCNEWNPEVNLRGTGRHAALTAGMMLAMQNTPLDSAMFYDARFGTSIYGSLFNPLTREPFPAYYAFIAFNELFRRGNQVQLTGTAPGLYAIAAKDETDGCLVIVNTNPNAVPLTLTLSGTVTGCRMLDGGHSLTECEVPDSIPAETVLCLTVKPK